MLKPIEGVHGACMHARRGVGGAHPPGEVLDATCEHEFRELPEEVVAGDGFVVQLWELESVHGGEDWLGQLLPVHDAGVRACEVEW